MSAPLAILSSFPSSFLPLPDSLLPSFLSSFQSFPPSLLPSLQSFFLEPPSLPSILPSFVPSINYFIHVHILSFFHSSFLSFSLFQQPMFDLMQPVTDQKFHIPPAIIPAVYKRRRPFMGKACETCCPASLMVIVNRMPSIDVMIVD